MQVTKYDSMIPVSELKVHDILVTATDTQYISSISAEFHSGEIRFNLKLIGSSSKSPVDRNGWSDRATRCLKFYMPVTLVRYSDGYFDLINDSMREFRNNLNSIKNSSSDTVEQIIAAVHRLPKGLELCNGLDLFIYNREINLHGIVERLVRDKLDNCLGTTANRQTDFAYVSSYNLALCILAGEGIDKLRSRLEISNTARAEAYTLQQVANDAWKIS